MELREYQKEDIEKVLPYNAVGFFNQQRTGKTPTTLNYITQKGVERVLIVCPASLLYTWKDEFEKWTGKPCIVFRNGVQVEKEMATWTHGAILSYDLLKPTKTRKGYVPNILEAKPDAIIIDEAHRIKNPKSSQAKAIFKFTKVPIRIALTGTPAPNRPEEIFSILHFLYPTEFNSYWKFVETYFKQEIKYGNGRSFTEVVGWKPGMRLELQKRLDVNCTNRRRKDIMPWLSDKDISTIKLELNKQQRKYLEDLSKYYETENLTTKGTLDRLIRYRQICLSPELVTLKGKSPKIEWILQYLADYPDKPVVIFSKFTSFLEILNREIQKHTNLRVEKVTGRVSSELRYKYIYGFQHGSIDVLLVNTDAGKEGLTLDKAEVSIFTDIYPPVGDLEQAEDRIISTRPQMKDKPSTIIRLIMKDSYEEELEKMIRLKSSNIDVINNFKKYLKGEN